VELGISGKMNGEVPVLPEHYQTNSGTDLVLGHLPREVLCRSFEQLNEDE